MMLGQAQPSSNIEVFVSSGYFIPSSPMTFSNYWKMQYGCEVGVGYALSPSIMLIGSVEYVQFKLNQDGVNKGFDTQYMSDIWIFDNVSVNPSADQSSLMTASLNVRFTPSDRVRFLSPYFLCGGGVMKFTLGEIALPTTSVLTLNNSVVSMTAERKILGGTETAVFMQSGIGFDLNITETIRPFVEARYVFGFTKNVNTSYIPLSVGVKFQF
jgi:hypothetical protein